MKYPIGLQDFAGLRQEGYLYADKTGLIYDLTHEYRYVFLSRPRRFGKSLLLSTIRYYFQGRKELFEGLEIAKKEKNWVKYPVLHLSLARVNADSSTSLIDGLDNEFSIWEKELGIVPTNSDLAFRFSNIIRASFHKHNQKVVILIDEYDNPLINSIEDSSIYNSNRSLLKSVYSNLKDLDEFIKFSMLTGVSRFSNMTLFSGLNNLSDISLSEKFTSICGFTEKEISDIFNEGVSELATSLDVDKDKALELLKKEYDGYHFSKNLLDIYNPFSLLNSLKQSEIQNYWIRSGVPSFIVKKLEDSKEPFSKIFNAKADSFSLAETDTVFQDPVALLFQTGYLTIKKYNTEIKEYTLGIPNREVEEGLLSFILDKYSDVRKSENSRLLREMSYALKEGEPGQFLESLKSVLASISYRLNSKMSELDFERTMFIVLHLLGLEVNVELETSAGRIDMVVKTPAYIYLMEFKLDKSAEVALKQIEDKEYWAPYKNDHRKIFLIGVNFSSKTRNLQNWLIK